MAIDIAKAAQAVGTGACFLGIEFGSTRIKAVLIDERFEVLATGTHGWENRLENGYWTYTSDDIWDGLAGCYASLKTAVRERYGVTLTRLGALGMSAMMHGYLPFDTGEKQLAAFRTWRNTNTAAAARELTELFGFHIPERWSIAHLRQAMLDHEPHTRDVAYLTTLAGLVHWRLTGKKVLGVGDASGMFPIDSATGTYDAGMMARFDELAARENMPWRLSDLLPAPLPAGEPAGILTEAGARLLDPEGDLMPGVPLCPPDGDAGTGMVATDSVAPRTGNVSAGTSIFSMVVLEHALRDAANPQIDLVTTPVGDPVAMVHCNNCTSDINAWVDLLASYSALMGQDVDKGSLYARLFEAALAGDKDAGGLVSIPFVSGETIMGVQTGYPLVLREQNAAFNVANLMRMNIMSAFGALAVGNEALRAEQVGIDRLCGHGGIFKTPHVAQSLLAAALQAPVTVMETAGEGGAWGMALEAAYLALREEGESLSDFLGRRVFAGMQGETLAPDETDVEGYAIYLQRFMKANEAEKAAEAAYATDV